MRAVRGAVGAGAVVLSLLVSLGPGTARAVYECGGEFDTCICGRANYCLCCDGACANCVWHAWHSACCHWGRALEWCTDAGTWNDYAVTNGYPTGSTPADTAIFVCEASGTCSGWGHVGYVVTAHADGSFDSTEQSCGGTCDTHSRTRAAGFATGGFIYNPGGTIPPPGNDNAAFVSETIPDGTHFRPGEAFVKRWTMRNTGDTTWTRTDNYQWAFDGDQQFGAAAQTLLPDGTAVGPGATRDWDVPMTAPAAPGTYRGYWRMDRFGTHRFGDRVWVEIVVDAVATDADGDGYSPPEDCNDGDASVHPGATEVCDGNDNDCDGTTDEDCVADDLVPDGGTDGTDTPQDGAGDAPGDTRPDGIRLDVPYYDARTEAGDGTPGASGGDGGCGCVAAGSGSGAGAFVPLLVFGCFVRSLRRRSGGEARRSGRREP